MCGVIDVVMCNTYFFVDDVTHGLNISLRSSVVQDHAVLDLRVRHVLPVARVEPRVQLLEHGLSKFCKTLSDSENPGRSCATQRIRCNQVFRGTATGED